MERVLDFIDHHLDIHITIAMLSRRAGISPFHSARLFRRRTEASPFEYITRLRMQRAAENLVAPDQRVGEIANAIGYEHAGHFATAFKRVYGETPIASVRGIARLSAESAKAALSTCARNLNTDAMKSDCFRCSGYRVPSQISSPRPLETRFGDLALVEIEQLLDSRD